MSEYKRILQKARKDLANSLQQKVELDSRVASLKRLVFDLATLAGEPMSKEEEEEINALVDNMQGITNGIRRVLSKANTPMSAPEIRDALKEKMEYKSVIEGYANPLSVLHNTLTRLIRQDEVVQIDKGFLLKEKS